MSISTVTFSIAIDIAKKYGSSRASSSTFIENALPRRAIQTLLADSFLILANRIRMPCEFRYETSQYITYAEGRSEFHDPGWSLKRAYCLWCVQLKFGALWTYHVTLVVNVFCEKQTLFVFKVDYRVILVFKLLQYDGYALWQTGWIWRWGPAKQLWIVTSDVLGSRLWILEKSWRRLVVRRAS